MPHPVISLIVPVRNPGDAINRLVDSADEQSLPAAAFELVLVDHGSDRATLDRLDHLRRRRPNVTVATLPAGSTLADALNHGIELAAGTFVLPLGHGELLFPAALEKLTAFAAEHDCDLVVGRGVGPARPSIDQALTTADVPRLDPHLRLAATSHPFVAYRREFLQQHGLRYRAGRALLDRTFHAEALAHTDAVGVFAGYPLARGHGLAEAYPVRDAEPSRAQWWEDVAGALDRTTDAGARAVFLAAEVAVAVHWLGLAGDEKLRPVVQDAVRNSCPAELDRLIAPVPRLVVDDFREGRWTEAGRVLAGFSGLRATAEAGAARWVDDALQVELTGRIETPGSLDLRNATYQRMIAETMIILGVRNRLTAPLHCVPTEGFWSVDTESDRPGLRFTARARLDPDRIHHGGPLPGGTWQVACYVPGLSIDTAPVLPVPLAGTPTTIRDHRLIAVVGGTDETLHFDIGGTTCSGLSGLRPEHTELVETPAGSRLTITLPDVRADRQTVLQGAIRFGRLSFPARLSGGPDGSRVECFASGLSGDYPISMTFGDGRPTPTGLTLRIEHAGAMIIIPA
ncbi:glycosyltransferase [Microlunatus sp. GCM10028923]|uniref:glycosyltransferase n=1 Tax=Microlunatus sp. GCM10028923 TaxID=3273400 RepID=UPI0036062A4F